MVSAKQLADSVVTDTLEGECKVDTRDALRYAAQVMQEAGMPGDQIVDVLESLVVAMMDEYGD